jgi:DNA-binding MarR family transcriptional regulator
MSTALAIKMLPLQTEIAHLKPLYVEALSLVERLHRRLLDVIKDEFDRTGLNDLNSVQALLLFNIGESEMAAAELRTRGYYLGSNVSYNLKKLADLGYLLHQRSAHDQRRARVSLTEKGRGIANIVHSLYERHVRTIDEIGGLAPADLQNIRHSLRRLDRFLTDQMLFQL